MKKSSVFPGETIRQVVDIFWDTFPPLWHRIRAYIRQTASERYDISVEQFHILRLIRRGQQSVSQLADIRNISRAATSQVVQVLVNKGLVSRTIDTQDRRHVQLSLTEAGDALLDTIFTGTKAWMEEVFTALNDDEIHAVIEAMEALRKLHVS